MLKRRLGASAVIGEDKRVGNAADYDWYAAGMGFAYPYGDFDAGAREAVKDAGFAFACSVRRWPAMATQDIFALPRIYIPNVGGDAFEMALRSASIGD